MGIPYYYYNIVNKYGNIIQNEISKCQRLFLDFNSIIHQSSAVAINKNPQNYTYESIFEEIVNFTEFIIKLCAPTELVYIAVDGVAPRAKIQQQRKRRYISAFRNEKIKGFKEFLNIPTTDWDSNCITPGTDFMHKLDSYLNEFYKNYAAKYKVIISGHLEEGEGEHKIINFLKQKNNDEYDVIYGLDADLIMLSLSCEKSNIYLMREADNFQQQKTGPNTYKYLNIDMLRISICKFLYNSEDISYMYDYIFMCFLLGNDFLPNISFLKIKTGAIEILCDIYKKIYSSLQKQLVVKDTDVFTINLQFLQKIFEHLSKIEEELSKEAVKQYNDQYFNEQKRFPSKLEKMIYELESYPVLHKFQTIKPETDNQWKAKYYDSLFGSASYLLIKKTSTKYIEGLIWITNYYFNKSYDKKWFYPFDYSPCVNDLYKYLYTMNDQSIKNITNKLQTTKGPNINTIQQMLMVLPTQSKHLIPDKYQILYTNISNGCAHYFPKYFELCTFLKTQLWECYPKLPVINLEYLDSCIKKIE